jgi:hypothetical protein
MNDYVHREMYMYTCFALYGTVFIEKFLGNFYEYEENSKHVTKLFSFLFQMSLEKTEIQKPNHYHRCDHETMLIFIVLF